MIFFLINMILCFGLILFSVQIDAQTSMDDVKNKKSRPLVDMILWLVVTSIFFLVVFASTYFGNNQLVNLCGKVVLFSLVVFVSCFFLFSVSFPDFSKNKIFNVIQVVICLFGAFVISKLDSFAFDLKNSIVIRGEKEACLGFNWLHVYNAVFFFGNNFQFPYMLIILHPKTK